MTDLLKELVDFGSSRLSEVKADGVLTKSSGPDDQMTSKVEDIITMADCSAFKGDVMSNSFDQKLFNDFLELKHLDLNTQS